MVHEDLQQRHQPWRELDLAAIANHPALIRIQLEWPDSDCIVILQGQKLFDAVDQFLHGEWQCQDQIRAGLIVGVCIRVDDEDDGKVVLFFLQ